MDPTFKGLSAPTPSKVRPAGPKWKRPALIGAGILVLFIVIGYVANMLTPNTTTLAQRLLYRLDALTTMTTNARPNIKSEDLGKINSELSLVLNGDNATVKKNTPTVKATKELAAIKTEETDAATTTKLKTALVNGEYDTVYKTTLIQKIETTSALINELHGKTTNKNLKSSLETTFSHLRTYYQQLKNLQ